MENNEPNKIVNALYKRFLELRKEQSANNYDYKAEQQLKDELTKITNVVGAIEVMSKVCIVKLITMQSRLRFMHHHTFYMQFDKALPYLTKEIV